MSIALKFSSEGDHGEAGLLYMFKVKGKRSRDQSSRSQRNVSAVKRYKTATDRLSDFKLGIGDEIRADGDWLARRRVASSCNASQIATFCSRNFHGSHGNSMDIVSTTLFHTRSSATAEIARVGSHYAVQGY